MTTPPEKAASLPESTDPAANRGTYLGFLVWVAGFLFLLIWMVADLVLGLLFHR